MTLTLLFPRLPFKVNFQVRTIDPTVTDRLLVGVQYPESEKIFFAKGSMKPQNKTEPIVPMDVELDDIEGIYWENVPSNGKRMRQRSFSTQFLVSPLFDPTQKVVLFPGACLTDSNGDHYCCRFEEITVGTLISNLYLTLQTPSLTLILLSPRWTCAHPVGCRKRHCKGSRRQQQQLYPSILILLTPWHGLYEYICIL